MMLLSMMTISVIAENEIGVDLEYRNAAQRLTPLSPQASMMQRFGNYPVDYSTGVPHISVPLYTIKVGDFELPISIDYHNSGIRVQDMATQVGLGWVLNAGGCISVMVKGGYDVKQEKGKQWSCRQEMDEANGYIYDDDKWEDIALGRYGDTESDRYCYNFCGHSGVFRRKWHSVNKTPEFVSMPYSDMQIQMQSSQYYGMLAKISNLQYAPFVLTDNNGIVYHFDYPEISVGESGDYYNSPSAITYYLTKIELPNKRDSIVFHYSKASLYQTYSHSEYLSRGVGYEHNGLYSDNYSTGDPLYGLTWKWYSFDKNNRHYVTESKLDYIEWNGNKILFDYKDDRKEKRQDVQPLKLKRLTNVMVMNHEGTVIKQISLDNDYYSGSWEGDYRMFLRSVSIRGTDESDEGTYSFEYYNDFRLPNYCGIPHPITNADKNKKDENCHEDYWGYYNGMTSESWVPSVYSVYANGANRTSTPLARTGSLLSVSYPTGGKTQYDMEINRLDDKTPWGGLRVKCITDFDNTGKLIGRKTYEYKDAIMPLDSSEFKNLYRYYEWRKYVTPTNNNRGPVTAEEREPRIFNVEVNNPCIPLTADYGAPVYYSTVVEYDGTPEEYTGITLYQYEEGRSNDMESFSYQDHGDFETTYYPSFGRVLPLQFYSKWYNWDFGNIRMFQKSVSRYNSNEKILYKQIYDYENVYIDTVLVGISIKPLFTWHNYKTIARNFGCLQEKPWLWCNSNVEKYVNDNYLFRDVWAVPSYKRLASTTEYCDGVTTKTIYGYDEDKRTLSPKSKSVSIANNNLAQASSTTTYTYPFESSGAIAQKMTAINMQVPLKTVTSRSGTVVRTDSVAYGTVGNGIQPKEYYTATGSERLEKRLTYSYDSKGRVLSLTTDAGDCTVFVWGNRNDWPIAKIEGKTLEEIRTCIGEGQYQNMFSETPTEYMLYASKDKLQAHNCTMTIYSYETLVGVKSIIHPNNNTETFDYDGLGRLLHRNENNKLCEEYQYNYRKQ